MHQVNFLYVAGDSFQDHAQMDIFLPQMLFVEKNIAKIAEGRAAHNIKSDSIGGCQK